MRPCAAWNKAKKQGEKYYFTGNPCRRGHIAQRSVSSRDCTECVKQNHERRAENIKAYNRNWYHAHKESRLAYAKATRTQKRKYHREHYRKNRARYFEQANARRVRKTRAMPKWADRKKIRGIYKTARLFTETTGIKFHVDHIVPLTNPIVCGLHIPANLQILSESQNKRKSNTFTET